MWSLSSRQHGCYFTHTHPQGTGVGWQSQNCYWVSAVQLTVWNFNSTNPVTHPHDDIVTWDHLLRNGLFFLGGRGGSISHWRISIAKRQWLKDFNCRWLEEPWHSNVHEHLLHMRSLRRVVCVCMIQRGLLASSVYVYISRIHVCNIIWYIPNRINNPF